MERAQGEIEALRAELVAKEDEIERLREAVSSPTRTEPERSLDDEMLSSLRQQHALDLSAAHSQVRALESSVFNAEARSHALQKQVSTLEDQLAHYKFTSRVPPTFSSGIPSRPSSRNDLRRTSIGSHRPSQLGVPLVRSILDQNLTPETRHKRMVSLSMLKARIDSEAAAASHPPSRAITPVPHLPTVVEPTSRPASPQDHHRHHHRRPQFLDESHVFWCHSCRGDLVIL